MPFFAFQIPGMSIRHTIRHRLTSRVRGVGCSTLGAVLAYFLAYLLAHFVLPGGDLYQVAIVCLVLLVCADNNRPPSCPKGIPISAKWSLPPFRVPALSVCPHVVPATATCGGRRHHYGAAGFQTGGLCSRIAPLLSVSRHSPST